VAPHIDLPAYRPRLRPCPSCRFPTKRCTRCVDRCSHDRDPDKARKLTFGPVQLAREIEAQAAVAQQQIGLARTQMTSKQREQRLVRLTLSELAGLSDDAVVYEGVGKM